MKKIIVALAALLFASAAVAQNLPAGSVGVVTNNTVNTWQTYTYTFTPSTTGANYIGFAFRQDPAFWTFDNVKLTAAGSQTNLLTNGAFNTGGTFSVTTNNGPSSMQAPTNWGVWYQNGTYPAAAGTWTDIGGAHGGVWYDGAVGTFDGIYQGVVLQAGTSYTISFEVSGNGTSNGSSIQLGVYGGSCATVNIAADQCTIPAAAGFTTLATPAQGASAGSPTPPPVTLVSTTNIASTAVSTTTYGTPVVVNRVVDASTNDRIRFTVTRTTTPITTRPVTVTTVTTPHTLQTYSDNSTVTTNGTAVTTVANSLSVTTGQSSAQTATASSDTTKNAIAVRKINPFLVDPLSTKDGAWATPMYAYAKAGGSFRSGGFQTGYQTTVDGNSAGFAFGFARTNSGDFLNASTNNDSYSGTIYALTKQEYFWVKGALGFGVAEHNTLTSIPTFALSNLSKIKQKDFYADVTFYSPTDFAGIRPLVGGVMNRTSLSATETGSALLSSTPAIGGTNEFRPYAGLRYDYDKDIGFETRLTYSKDFKTVSQNRLTIRNEIVDNVFLEATGGFDKGSNYTGALGMVGVKVNF